MAKIYWGIHGYPPRQNAGAEWMAFEITNYLIHEYEHNVFVHFPGEDFRKEIQDIKPDIVFTHLDMSEEVTNFCIIHNIPCINFIHHTFDIPHLKRLSDYASVAVAYNAVWTAEKCRYSLNSMIVHPPVNPLRFVSLAMNPKYITLVNCNKDKGALIFQDIARMMPNRTFLAVKGHHGPQIPLRANNLIQVPAVDDIREILTTTSILLVPSVYESYGRIAIEALACGIPVIATDTPGLREALEGSDAKLIKSRSHVPAWVEAIIRTTPRSHYTTSLDVGRIKFAQEKWNKSLLELDELNTLIKQLIAK